MYKIKKGYDEKDKMYYLYIQDRRTKETILTYWQSKRQYLQELKTEIKEDKKYLKERRKKYVSSNER